MSGLLLNLGCGSMLLRDWLNVDVFPREGVVQGTADRIPVASGSVRAVVMFDVIEHLHPKREVPAALAELHRVLQPGGVARISTPDLAQLARAYVEGTMGSFGAASQPRWYRDECPAMQFSAHAFANNADTTPAGVYEGHQALYDEESLRRALAGAGFNEAVRQRPGESLSEDIRNGVTDPWPSTSLIMEAVRW